MLKKLTLFCVDKKLHRIMETPPYFHPTMSIHENDVNSRHHLIGDSKLSIYLHPIDTGKAVF